MSPLFDHRQALASDSDRLRALKAEGYTVYAQTPNGEGEPKTLYLQRPRPADDQATPEPKPEPSAEPSASGLPPVATLGLGARADAAFADAGFSDAASVLALSDEDAAAVPGIGPATLDKLTALRS